MEDADQDDQEHSESQSYTVCYSPQGLPDVEPTLHCLLGRLLLLEELAEKGKVTPNVIRKLIENMRADIQSFLDDQDNG